MKCRSKIAVAAILTLLAVSMGINIVFAVNQGVEPGSDQDPIVSKSYVDAAISQLSSKIQLLLEQNDALKNQNTQLAARLENQEKAIKALQEALNSKIGTADSSTSTPAAGLGNTGSGSGNKGSGAPTSIGKAVVNVAVLNLRAQPNTTSAILGKLKKNETVTLVSKSGSWYKVTTSSGKTGFVMGKYVTVK